MKKIVLLFIISIFSLISPCFAADKYEFDKSHMRILFFVNHIGFSDMVGEFTDYDGSFTFDPKKPEDSRVEISLKPSGIRTSSQKLDDDLQGEKFFNSDKFLEIKFVSTKIKVTGKNRGEVLGNLTMLGVTKPFTLKVRFNKADYHPISKDFVAGFSAEARLKRSDFGMDSYLPMVGDEVRVMVEAEGINIDQKQRESLRRK